MAYTHWQSEMSDKTIICVHGLTRNGRDFDSLARQLVQHGHIYCPDIVGRGKSDWLSDYQFYDFEQYISDMMTLMAQIKAKDIIWIGTSMGGIMGMLMAAMPNTPVSALILNDVGNIIPKESLQQIANYVGLAPSFKTFEAGKDYFKTTHHEFAPMSDENWNFLASHSLTEQNDGMFALAYDPNIGTKMREGDLTQDVDLTPIWSVITCPTMIIRGENSTLLPKSTVQNMIKSKQNVSYIEVPTAGHAPSLNGYFEQNAIMKWISKNA